MTWSKPFPNVDADNQAFWDGLRAHEFRLFRCTTCGASYWPAAYCRACPALPFYGNMEWAPSSGRGRIFAFNVHRFAFHPGFKDDLPYVYALVELDEGPMFGTNVVDCLPANLYVGMAVEIAYRDVVDVAPEDGEPFTLACVRPTGS